MKGTIGFSEEKNPDVAVVKYDPNLAKSFPVPSRVLGASTESTPEQSINAVIGDNGDIIPIDSLGQVLGASSDAIEVTFTGKTIPTTGASFKQYLDDELKVEDAYIDRGYLEEALSTTNLDEIQKAHVSFENLVQELQSMTVPDAAIKYHTLKMQQFAAAAIMVKHLSDIDSNSELVSNALIEFMKTEESQSSELRNLQEKYYE